MNFKSRLFLSFLVLLTAAPSQSKTIQNKLEKCNVYYNNRGKVFEAVDCRVWFNSSGRLYRVNVFLPNANRWYDWNSMNNKDVSQDQRWKECIRHTGKLGNQYQVCSVKSPQQFGF